MFRCGRSRGRRHDLQGGGGRGLEAALRGLETAPSELSAAQAAAESLFEWHAHEEQLLQQAKSGEEPKAGMGA